MSTNPRKSFFYFYYYYFLLLFFNLVFFFGLTTSKTLHFLVLISIQGPLTRQQWEQQLESVREKLSHTGTSAWIVPPRASYSFLPVGYVSDDDGSDIYKKRPDEVRST